MLKHGSDQRGGAAQKNATVLSRKLPGVCDISVTNVCNAACDFCGFARDRTLVGPRRYIDVDAFARALPILHRRGIRYITLQGGEPLLHPNIIRLVSEISAAGMQPAIISNGWFLRRHIESLIAAGLKRLIVSIDSDDLAQHDGNRGLDGLSRRIKQGIAKARALGLPVTASVTISRLVRYGELPNTLRQLGVEGVAFSYPRREPFGSTSLVYGGDSSLTDLDRDELLKALNEVRLLRERFRVFNSAASLAEVERFVRGKQQYVPCVCGYKYFYLDWNLHIWRCEAWSEPLGSVFDFDRMPDQRDACNACMMACYRNASMLMHAGIAATDAVGPTVQVMPGPNKSFANFQSDQAVCRQFAQQAVGDQARNANLRALGTGALTTALGAGLGGAIGGGSGAGIGAAAGALGGAGLGTLQTSRAQNSIQALYDNAFAQCMFSLGNAVPGMGPMMVRPGSP